MIKEIDVFAVFAVVYYNKVGLLHMENNPTIRYIDRNKIWYKDGNKICENSKRDYHRDNGPAIEWANGDKFWYKEGKWYRLDGPTIEYSDGDKAWYIKDIRLEKERFNNWILRIQKCI